MTRPGLGSASTWCSESRSGDDVEEIKLTGDSTVPLLVAPDDRAFLETAARIYAKNDRYPEALALAVRLNDRDLIQEYFEAPRNPSVSWAQGGPG